MQDRGPYAHDVDGPQDRGPYAHGISTLALTKNLLVVTATYAALGPGSIDWGDASAVTTFTANSGAPTHTYAAAGVKTVTLTNAVGDVTVKTITLT
jgi:hypothetical protein